MDAGFEARLHAEGVSFDADDAALLRAVDEHGSLNAAATALGRSYSRAHGRLTDLEAAFGPLVERRRGGAGGGGSELTGWARELLSRFDRLRVEFAGTAEVEETVLPGRVTGREGELGTVGTPAGTVRAVVPPEGESVEVAVRADAVTLHAPEDAPAAGATSARNRFSGSVAGVEIGEAIARVAVEVGGPDRLVALLTRESVERLDLKRGDRVVASFKATATRAIPRDTRGT